MPEYGSPTVTFRKSDGSTFTKAFRSRLSASRAIRGWRSKGGKVVGSGSYGSKSGVVTHNVRGRKRRRFNRRY